MMLSAVNTSPVHIMYLRKKNTWYSVRDGNWTDPNIWSSNGNGRRGHKYPQEGDNVVVSHSVLINDNLFVSSGNVINDLTVTGKLSFSNSGAPSFNVMGNLYAENGTIDLTGGSGLQFNVYSAVTRFGTLLPGTLGQVGFVGSCSQYISKPLSGDFYRIYIFDPKYVYGNIPVTKYVMYDLAGVAVVGSYQVILELGNYDVEFNSAGFTLTGYNPPGVIPALSRKGTGTTVFKGLCTGYSGMDLGNNPVEFRNGLSGGGTINAGLVNFTTNNQSIRGSVATTPTTPVLIGLGLTLTLEGSTAIQGGITGTDAASIFYCSPGSNLTLGGAASEPMVTGQWNLAGFVTYSFTSGSFVIKKPSYDNFNIFNSNCAYVLGTDVTCSTFSFFQSSLDLANYNLTVNGAMSIQAAQLKRTGTGNTIIKGLFSYGGYSQIDLGSSTLELQAGLRTLTNFDNNNWKMGTLLMSTVNQTFSVNNAGNYLNLTGNIEIAPGLTVTNISNITVTGNINGQNASSVFDCQGLTTYQGTQAPMQTGILRCNTASNTFDYALKGNQDVTPGTYRNLTLSGSGIKKLSGNVSVINIYKLSSPATLDNNGFTLTNP
ncbi:hypothetical protein ACFFGT_10090 [Mucilaginibacter angelicae]|uniref:G8 domain-containing protein n=1 Tax=Mucilaginibacter angelicae TaxID=869718 RepID=A0ABV6L4Z3_9SPHI